MIGTVLDVFSHCTFSEDIHTLPLSIKHYRKEIEKNASNLDFVFVESVWRGNNNQWIVGRKKEKKRRALAIKRLADLTSLCRKLGIPTVFWGKEDPVNFSRFINVAKCFDYIFTTDVGSIRKYKENTKCNNVYVLPFAAQPKIHKFNKLENRKSKVAFAGTNYPNKNRRDRLNILLAGAAPCGLDIYDRGRLRGKTTFKGSYEDFVVGGLSYTDLVSKYNEYRAFINVDTIKNSPTMFSRRVFELLCCGTPVISAPSAGVDTMFKNIVISANRKENVTEYINLLFNNNEYWRFKSTRGLREIYRKHTVAHRLAFIYTKLGMKNLAVEESVSKYVDLASQMEL